MSSGERREPYSSLESGLFIAADWGRVAMEL
jgi:hypothetical protein